MSAAKPWMKFFPRDWRADEKLRNCSLAARGLWMEMLAVMHGSERYGHLLINGHVPTDAQLAVQAGASEAEVSDLVGQLEAAGVFSRNATGAIYSRRMTSDEKKARIARRNGKTGGNPTLRNQSDNSPSVKGLDNQADKAPLKLRGQSTEKKEGSEDKSSGSELPFDPVKELFDLGVAVLTGAGHAERHARALIGRWRKRFGDGPTMDAVHSANDKADPVSWIEAVLAKRDVDTNELFRAIDLKYGPPAEEPAPAQAAAGAQT